MIDRRERGIAWTAPPPEPWEESLPDGEGPVELGPRYLAAVARIEALPENQSGSDKGWVLRIARVSRARFRSAVRIR